jgi:hypothetical protein
MCSKGWDKIIKATIFCLEELSFFKFRWRMQNQFKQTSKWTIIVGFCVNNPQSEE